MTRRPARVRAAACRGVRAALGAAFALLAAGAASAQIACTADFSVMGQGRQAVVVKPLADGGFEARIDGVTTNAKGRVVDEVVRPDLNLGADPAGAEFAGFNGAERSLVHLHSVLALPQSRELVRVPFAPAAVRRLRTFDLVGRSDKFGGHVLLEAYDARGALLGRVVRRIFVAECRDG